MSRSSEAARPAPCAPRASQHWGATSCFSSENGIRVFIWASRFCPTASVFSRPSGSSTECPAASSSNGGLASSMDQTSGDRCDTPFRKRSTRDGITPSRCRATSLTNFSSDAPNLAGRTRARVGKLRASWWRDPGPSEWRRAVPMGSPNRSKRGSSSMPPDAMRWSRAQRDPSNASRGSIERHFILKCGVLGATR